MTNCAGSWEYFCNQHQTLPKMKPIMILSPGEMSPEDIKTLRDNDLCVVVAKHPASVRFVDPIPAATQRGKMEDAAIQLSRLLLNGCWGEYSNSNVLSRSDFAHMYVQCLVKGTPLDRNGTTEEQLNRAYDLEKLEETRRLARADAKAERAANKKALKEGDSKTV